MNKYLILLILIGCGNGNGYRPKAEKPEPVNVYKVSNWEVLVKPETDEGSHLIKVQFDVVKETEEDKDEQYVLECKNETTLTAYKQVWRVSYKDHKKGKARKTYLRLNKKVDMGTVNKITCTLSGKFNGQTIYEDTIYLDEDPNIVTANTFDPEIINNHIKFKIKVIKGTRIFHAGFKCTDGKNEEIFARCFDESEIKRNKIYTYKVKITKLNLTKPIKCISMNYEGYILDKLEYNL